MSATALPTRARRDLLLEVGWDDCQILSLLAGCYGSYAYMAESYGITPERCQQVVKSLEETVEWVNTEHGTNLTVRDATRLLIQAWDDLDLDNHWYELYS